MPLYKSKTEAQITGAKGEEIACAFLTQKGLLIRARNFHIGSYEIDMIASDDTYLLFVEVKTRMEDHTARPRGAGYGSAATAVSYTKRRNMVQAAQAYIRRELRGDTGGLQPRIDVIEVYLPTRDGEISKVHHIKNAVSRV